MKLGIVSSRVALLLRSTEIKPLFDGFVFEREHNHSLHLKKFQTLFTPVSLSQGTGGYTGEIDVFRVSEVKSEANGWL